MGHIYIYTRNGNNPIPRVLNTRQEPWFRRKKELIFGTMQQVCAIFREGSVDLSLSRVFHRHLNYIDIDNGVVKDKGFKISLYIYTHIYTYVYMCACVRV